MNATSSHCDFLVIGAGMAGASAAYELSSRGRVIVLERESQPGYHTTGRSAALFIESYGNAAVRAITMGGRSFYDAPPDGFAEAPLLSRRGVLYLARADQQASLEKNFAELSKDVVGLKRLSTKEAIELFPLLNPEYAVGALLDSDAMDMDVHAIHQGYLKGMRQRGGELVTSAEVRAAKRVGGQWQVETPAGVFSAPVLINAAGAWCDEVARLVGARTIGLVPKRRTAFIFDGPPGAKPDSWPLAGDIDEQFYFKPEAGKFFGSPADETPVPPQDVQPEEIDVAIAIERIQASITFEIKRVVRRWAGLRSFVKDKTPVVGYAPDVEGFFWLAGQGGYGIQTAPGMGRIAAALAAREPLPSEFTKRGLKASDLAPERVW